MTVCLVMPAMVCLQTEADSLIPVIEAELQTNVEATRSQKKIDKLSDDTRKMLDEYRHNLRQANVLKQYNDHLSKLVDSQVTEKSSLEKQLVEVDVTQQEVVPLMLRMLENLETFVAYDLPFLPDERRSRLNRLNQLMVRADVTTAEKFRQILEAYQIESDYGRTIEAYRADLKTDSLERPVDFLRLGRVALFYQSLDGGETGVWNHSLRRWDTLPSRFSKAVRDGLRIARKEAAPTLLPLPVPVPEAVK